MNAARKYDILGNDDHDLGISRTFDVRVKGLTTMSHSRNLSNYAEDLVINYAKFKNDQYSLFLLDLPEDEQNELVRLYMEANNRDTSECVHGNDFSIDNEYICALLAMLKDDCQGTREKFAEVTRKNIINYYQDSLQDLLDKACLDYLHDSNNEQSYFAHQDLEHGDIYWSRG